MAKQKKDSTSDVPTSGEVRDNLAHVLAESLNKTFKDYKVAYFLDGSESTPTDLTEWVSTGSSLLDLALSNRPNGGIPLGRLGEITGLEASGKSLLASHILANTQKKGGLAVYIDTENALNVDFLEAIGVDTEKLLYVQLETVEEIFQAIEDIIEKVRASSKDRIVTIVVDSVAAASTKQELEGDYDKDGWATAKAIIISKAMRKITNLVGKHRIALVFTNQLRQKLGVSFGDQWTTSGGKALAFHCSWRLRAKQMNSIKGKVNGVEQIVGIRTDVKVVKNRMGPPHRSAEFNILFDQGIDDLGGWIETMKAYGIVSQGGAWYTYINKDTGEEIKFQEKQFREILKTRQDIRASMYNSICDCIIMKYKKNNDQLNYDADEIELDSPTEGSQE